MKRLIFIVFALCLFSCKRDPDPVEPTYCWRCTSEFLTYLSHNRQPYYRVDSFDKCSYSESWIRKFEKDNTFTSLATDTNGAVIDTGYERVNCRIKN